MTTLETFIISSSSDEDDEPLRPSVDNMVQYNDTNDENSFQALCRRLRQPCDFCDSVFFNKYSSIIHNVSHIIIPLVNLEVYQCPECLFHFTSQLDLQIHSKKHTVNIKSEKIVEDYVDEKLNIKSEEIVKYYEDEKHAVTIKSEKIVQEPSLSLNTHGDELDVLDDAQSTETMDIDYEEYHLNALEIVKGLNFDSLFTMKDDPVTVVQENPTSNDDVKTRILFDDDGVEEALSEELEVINNLGKDTCSKPDLGKETCSKPDLGKETCSKPDDVNSNYCDSIHYEDLISTDVIKCKVCRKLFQNRYEQIKHQALHIGFRNNRTRYLVCHVCDKYIAGNYITLDKHILHVHGERQLQTDRSSILFRRCKLCSLRFVNFSSHYRLYHLERYIPPATAPVPSVSTATNHNGHKQCFNGIHEKVKGIVKIKELCTACFFFFKKTTKSRYSLGKIKMLEGKRLNCEECKKEVFELRVVQILGKKSFIGEKVKDFCVPPAKYRNVKYYTNRNRLKNIQQRLKTINYLNKF